MNIAAPEDLHFSHNILFSFWKGLELLPQRNPALGPSAAMREAFCQTILDLVRHLSGSAGGQILCAQSFYIIAQMFPASIFLDDEGDSRCSAGSNRNQDIKSASLKLIQGHSSPPNHFCYSLFHTRLKPPFQTLHLPTTPREALFISARASPTTSLGPWPA